MFTKDCLTILSFDSYDVKKSFWQFPFINSNLYFSQETNIVLFQRHFIQTTKTIRCSEAVYNEREIKPITLSSIPSSLQLKQKKKKKKAFCFKGKVRKIGQYIFLLHNNINSYKNSNCNKRNWILACTYSLKRQQAIIIPQEPNSTCLHRILLPFHVQVTPSQFQHWS